MQQAWSQLDLTYATQHLATCICLRHSRFYPTASVFKKPNDNQLLNQLIISLSASFSFSPPVFLYLLYLSLYQYLLCLYLAYALAIRNKFVYNDILHGLKYTFPWVLLIPWQICIIASFRINITGVNTQDTFRWGTHIWWHIHKYIAVKKWS